MKLSSPELYELYRREFGIYEKLLLKWNQKINLTAITKPEEIRMLHFEDSLAAIPIIQELRDKNVSRGTILDIGAGNGLPGLAIKIAIPEIHLTLVDSVKKKCDFMKEVSRQIGLRDIEARHHFMKPGESIGSFDIVISRAAFKLKDLIPIALPQLSQEGCLIAMKSADVGEELIEAKEAMKTAFSFEEISYSLSGDQKRSLIVVKRL